MRLRCTGAVGSVAFLFFDAAAIGFGSLLEDGFCFGSFTTDSFVVGASTMDSLGATGAFAFAFPFTYTNVF